MNRRIFVTSGIAFGLASVVQASPPLKLEVAKSPTCGCCTAWIDRMRADGFEVSYSDVEQEALWALKDKLSITEDLAGCHTATIGDYFIEGHVPAASIRRLIAEAPTARGLTVPGMPMGSPGMDMGGTTGSFNVLLVLKDNSTSTFATYS